MRNTSKDIAGALAVLFGLVTLGAVALRWDVRAAGGGTAVATADAAVPDAARNSVDIEASAEPAGEVLQRLSLPGGVVLRFAVSTDDETVGCATLLRDGEPLPLPWRSGNAGPGGDSFEVCESVNREFTLVKAPNLALPIVAETASQYLPRGEGTLGTVRFWQISPSGADLVLQLTTERSYEECPEGRLGDCDAPRSRSMEGTVRVMADASPLAIAYAVSVDDQPRGAATYRWNGKSFVSDNPALPTYYEVLDDDEGSEVQDVEVTTVE